MSYQEYISSKINWKSAPMSHGAMEFIIYLDHKKQKFGIGSICQFGICQFLVLDHYLSKIGSKMLKKFAC